MIALSLLTALTAGLGLLWSRAPLPRALACLQLALCLGMVGWLLRPDPGPAPAPAPAPGLAVEGAAPGGRRVDLARRVGQGRPRVLIDCDPGQDDALALIVASRFTEILGVTTVAGNAPLEAVTRNARIVLDLCGSAAPLHAGSARALRQPPRHAPNLHGHQAMNGATLPAPSRPPDSERGVEFLIRTIRANPGVWVVATGPLTNLARALSEAPDLPSRLGGFSIMGGGRFGNSTAAAEGNFWLDPEAAAQVLGSRARILLTGLHATRPFQATPARVARLGQAHPRLGPILEGLLGFYSRAYHHRYDGYQGAAMHDVCAVLALTHPELFEAVDRRVQVELSGRLTRGMSVIDDSWMREGPEPNVAVIERLRGEEAFERLLEAVRACP